MMTRYLSVFVAAGIVAVSIATTSCDHKDLCYGHEHMTKLRVLYDWSDAPEANPAGMCVFFYSVDNGNYYRFDFSNTVGGEIELPQGEYRVITYNNDTELVRFSASNDYDAHTAYTRTADLLEPLYGNGVKSTAKTENGEAVVMTPDDLWGCHVEEVVVLEHGVHYTFTRYDDSRGDAANKPDSVDYQTILLYPHDMLCHYSYEVRNVENVEKVNRVSASISGMSGTMKMSDESLDTKPITLPVEGHAEAAARKITGRFLTFGQNASISNLHKMTFYVVMNDGSKYVVKDAPNLDVTEQVDTAPDRRHVHIIIDGLKLPDSQTGDSGWIPTVDDWGEHDEDLKI